MDKNLSKPVKTLVSEQLALTSMFHFQQASVFKAESTKTCWNGFYFIKLTKTATGDVLQESSS